MSNKKQPQFASKPSSTDSGSNNAIPPRYQPPPLPVSGTGILKNPAGKDVKQFLSKVQENVKNPSDPSNSNNKYYPAAVPLKQFPAYPYPVGAHPQARPNPRTFEEDLRVQSQIHQDLIRNPPQRLDEPGIPQHPQDLRLHQIRTGVRGYSEEEFHRLATGDMLKFVRKTDPQAEQTRHLQMQTLIAELRSLKEANQRLADDNQELRDLCCFLDDDRQKGRKLAREWQRFGRYTASVMRQEVSAYQNKLRELDNKQQELIKDNLELKELCLYLDEERNGGSICPSCGSSTTGNLRDDGDGSSSSTNADEPQVPQQFNGGTNAPRRSASRERILHENLTRQRNTLNDQTMQYVRNLEQRIKQLEEEKKSLTLKINQLASAVGDPGLVIAPSTQTADNTGLTGRPEAVVRALQVLEVREQLEREARDRDEVEERGETVSQDMDDGEKALVREMCNVVWRKLEEAPPPPRR